jgi:hypothetical protein
MGTADESVNLTAEQARELGRRLRHMRHAINNHLSLIVAAAEIIRLKPEMVSRMAPTLLEQPQKITERIEEFSTAFDLVLKPPGGDSPRTDTGQVQNEKP